MTFASEKYRELSQVVGVSTSRFDINGSLKQAVGKLTTNLVGKNGAEVRQNEKVTIVLALFKTLSLMISVCSFRNFPKIYNARAQLLLLLYAAIVAAEISLFH